MEAKGFTFLAHNIRIYMVVVWTGVPLRSEGHVFWKIYGSLQAISELALRAQTTEIVRPLSFPKKAGSTLPLLLDFFAKNVLSPRKGTPVQTTAFI